MDITENQVSILDGVECQHDIPEGTAVSLVYKPEDGKWYLRALSYFEYEDGVYQYETKDEWHLIINNEDVFKDIEVVWCRYYGNGVYSYKTKDGKWHLIINNEDVFKDIEVVWCRYYGNGVYEYITKDKLRHLNINNDDVLKDKKAVDCYYENGNYGYQTEDGLWHEFPAKSNKYKFFNLLNPWRILVKKIKIMLDN